MKVTDGRFLDGAIYPLNLPVGPWIEEAYQAMESVGQSGFESSYPGQSRHRAKPQPIVDSFVSESGFPV